MDKLIHTFGYIRGVRSAQQVSDVKPISVLLTEPLVTGKVEPKVGPDDICRHHSVQEPAGIHTCIVMLNSVLTEENNQDKFVSLSQAVRVRDSNTDKESKVNSV